MKSKLMLLAFLCFLTKLSLGQDTVITVYGDTLKGSYDILRGYNGIESVKVKLENAGKETFKIYQVKRIEDENGDIYEPIQLNRYITFGRKVKEGFLSLYYYTDDGSTARFNQLALVKADNSSIKVPGFMGFRKAMSDFLDDCPRVADKIDNKDLGKSDLYQIIDEYNACLDTKTEVILATETSKTKEVTINEELTKQFETFRETLKNSSAVNNKKEALDMFNDFADKLANGENIPSYLSNALKQAISTDEALTEMLNNLLKQ